MWRAVPLRRWALTLARLSSCHDQVDDAFEYIEDNLWPPLVMAVILGLVSAHDLPRAAPTC